MPSDEEKEQPVELASTEEAEGSTEPIDEGEEGEPTQSQLTSTGEEGQEESPANGEIPAPLASRLSELEKRVLDQQMENLYLKGQLSQRAQPPPPEAGSAPSQEPEDDLGLPSDEELENALRSSPTATIKQLLKQVAARTEKRVEKRLSSATSDSVKVQQQFQQDSALLQKNYGALLDRESTDYNEEFDRTATHVYNGLISQFGEIPGLKTMAAATAYGELVRSGRMQAKQQQKPLLAGQSGVKERIRSVPPNPLVRSKGGNGPVPQTAKDPLNGFSNDEKASIQRTCEELGISPKEWRASYEAAKKENPDYA